MTFTEIFNHVYQSNDGIRERVAALAPDERGAWGVLAVLGGRKGFNGWWGGVDDECRNEIFEELKAAYAKDGRVLEAAALTALEEWRRAELVLEGAKRAWQAKDTTETYRGYCAAQVRAKETIIALRKSVDDLLGAREGGE